MNIHPGIISTASNFQNKSTQTEPQISAKKLKRCGAKILDANRSAFPLGGDETDVVKKSTNQFKFILDELIADFITKDSFFNQKIKTLFNDKKISLEERNSFKKARQEVINLLESLGINRLSREEKVVEIVRDALIKFCSEKNDFTSVITLMKLINLCTDKAETMRADYSKKKGETWLEDWSDHLLPYFALNSYHLSKEQQKHHILQGSTHLENYERCVESYKTGCFDEEGSKEYKNFFHYIYDDVCNALRCGAANSDVMADFSFLRAMYLFQDSSMKVSYIRFQSPEQSQQSQQSQQSPEYEAIHAIALGNFPEVGSLIVDPWSHSMFIIKDADQAKLCTDHQIIFSSKSEAIRKKLLEEIKSFEEHDQESRKVVKKDVEEIRKSYQKFQQDLPDGFKSPIPTANS